MRAGDVHIMRNCWNPSPEFYGVSEYASMTADQNFSCSEVP